MGQQLRHRKAAIGKAGMHVLPAGARVLTLDGTLPVEYLVPGDRVITRDSGAVHLVATHSVYEKVNCVWLAPGSVGERRPTCYSLMAAQTVIYLRRKAGQGTPRMVSAGRLLDGVSVRYAGRPKMTMVELTFDAPHILYVDGLELAPINALSETPEPTAKFRANPLQ